MALATAFISYIGKFLLIAACGVIGFIAGKKLKDKKTVK